jgi:probable F420-dependent oxidoreductase
LVLATGIANIFLRHPGAMKQAAMTLAEASGARFVLGLGVSHARTVESLRGLDHSRPLSKMRDYLAEMDASPYSAPTSPAPVPRVLAALGPKMLTLAGEAADGAHSYSMTVEHTARARQALGQDAMLCVEQKVVFTTDAEAARAAGRTALQGIRRLPSYVRCWRASGFSEEEIDELRPRFVDELVAWGDEEALRSRIEAHSQAGASHVCIQPLVPDLPGYSLLTTLRALAPRGSA